MTIHTIVRITAGIASLAVALLANACGQTSSAECRRSSECPETAFCFAGECTDPRKHSALVADAGASPTTDTEATGRQDDSQQQWRPPSHDTPDASTEDVGDADAGHTEDAAAPVGRCAGAAPPLAGAVAINEVLASVPAGPDGDANGDGTRDAYEDEFIELVNASNATVELFGASLYLDDRLIFNFEPQCLDAHESLVIFGGGSPWLDDPDQKVVNADYRLALRNSGGTVRLVGSEGTLISEFPYGEVDGRSWVRVPEVTGEGTEPHEPERFSPGRCRQGETFAEGCSDLEDDTAADAG